MAPYNKIFQKKTVKLKTCKTFSLLFIINSRISSVSFKLLPRKPPCGPFTAHGPLNFCNCSIGKLWCRAYTKGVGVSFARGEIFARRPFCTQGHFCTNGQFCTATLLLEWTLLHCDSFARRNFVRQNFCTASPIADVTFAWRNFCKASLLHGVTFIFLHCENFKQSVNFERSFTFALF